MNLLTKKYTLSEARQINPLILAFIGDTIYDLFVRVRIIEKNSNRKIKEIHKNAVSFVNARSQSDFAHKLLLELNHDEEYIFKKGRNIKSNSSPKNVKIVDYKNATGLECLIGYLYITEQTERLKEILEKVEF